MVGTESPIRYEGYWLATAIARSVDGCAVFGFEFKVPLSSAACAPFGVTPRLRTPRAQACRDCREAHKGPSQPTTAADVWVETATAERPLRTGLTLDRNLHMGRAFPYRSGPGGGAVFVPIRALRSRSNSETGDGAECLECPGHARADYPDAVFGSKTGRA